MKKQRFKVERSTEGNIFELAFVLLTIVVWVAIVMLYHQAPDIIPTHFGPSGAPDAYGPKTRMFFPCIIVTVVAVCMMAGAYFPHSVNLPGVYLVNERQAALRLMRVLGILFLLLAGAVALDMMRGHVLFVLIMIVVMVLVCPVFIYFIYREG